MPKSLSRFFDSQKHFLKTATVVLIIYSVGDNLLTVLHCIHRINPVWANGNRVCVMFLLQYCRVRRFPTVKTGYLSFMQVGNGLDRSLCRSLLFAAGGRQVGKANAFATTGQLEN